jgi:hypothetical protein
MMRILIIDDESDARAVIALPPSAGDIEKARIWIERYRF